MSKVTKSPEESYAEYATEQQKEEIERLAYYQALREWLDSLNVADAADVVKILDLCAKLVTAETWEWEDIIGQIEEELR